MPIGLLTLHLSLPGCSSLKEKRSILKPVLVRLHRQFNISTAEVDQQDYWQSAVIACAMASNDSVYAQTALQAVVKFFEQTWPNLPVQAFHIQII